MKCFQYREDFTLKNQESAETCGFHTCTGSCLILLSSMWQLASLNFFRGQFCRIAVKIYLNSKTYNYLTLAFDYLRAKRGILRSRPVGTLTSCVRFFW